MSQNIPPEGEAPVMGNPQYGYDPNQYQMGQDPNQNYYQQPGQYGPQPKSKIAAGVLGILLGAFGVHNFYLGYNGKAVAQLLITLLTCGIGAAISSIWGLIEGILILTGSITTDAKGVPLKD